MVAGWGHWRCSGNGLWFGVLGCLGIYPNDSAFRTFRQMIAELKWAEADKAYLDRLRRFQSILAGKGCLKVWKAGFFGYILVSNLSGVLTRLL